MLRLALAAVTAALVAAVGAALGSGATPGGYDPSPPSPPAPPPSPPPTISGPRALLATVGPAHEISLKTSSGARVRRLRPGTYTITVDDRAQDHNFRLSGPGVKRRTGIAFVGQTRWRVRFRKGKTYRFRCDPHLSSMRGTFRVR